jgi:5-methylcytosine-specific restriction endonuclease McrA
MIEVAGHQFRSQPALKAHIKALFLAHGKSSFDANAATHAFLLELFKRHPRYQEKIVKGVKRFRVTKITKHNGVHFETVVVRDDGSLSNLSINTCITKKEKQPLPECLDAMRATVNPTTRTFRESSSGKCAVCGKPGDEVDHCGDKEFRVLAQEYIDDHGVCAEIGRVDGRIGFTNVAYREGWKEHHDNHAQLQLLCNACHVAKTRKRKHE